MLDEFHLLHKSSHKVLTLGFSIGEVLKPNEVESIKRPSMETDEVYEDLSAGSATEILFAGRRPSMLSAVCKAQRKFLVEVKKKNLLPDLNPNKFHIAMVYILWEWMVSTAEEKKPYPCYDYLNRLRRNCWKLAHNICWVCLAQDLMLHV